MQVEDNTTHVRKVTVQFEDADLKQLIRDAAAKRAGVDLREPGVQCRTWMRINGSSNEVKATATVELHVDMTALPTAAPEA